MLVVTLGPWQVGDSWAAALRRRGLRVELHTADPATRAAIVWMAACRLLYHEVHCTLIDMGPDRPAYLNRMEVGPQVVAMVAASSLAAQLRGAGTHGRARGSDSAVPVEKLIVDDPAAIVRGSGIDTVDRYLRKLGAEDPPGLAGPIGRAGGAALLLRTGALRTMGMWSTKPARRLPERETPRTGTRPTRATRVGYRVPEAPNRPTPDLAARLDHLRGMARVRDPIQDPETGPHVLAP